MSFLSLADILEDNYTASLIYFSRAAQFLVARVSLRENLRENKGSYFLHLAFSSKSWTKLAPIQL